jgi:hypothetical protein
MYALLWILFLTTVTPLHTYIVKIATYVLSSQAMLGLFLYTNCFILVKYLPMFCKKGSRCGSAVSDGMRK